jgi:hypothetical protein
MSLFSGQKHITRGISKGKIFRDQDDNDGPNATYRIGTPSALPARLRGPYHLGYNRLKLH